jgi:chromosome segregation protein
VFIQQLLPLSLSLQEKPPFVTIVTPMIISRLEIHGFKSFADKVSLDFRQGITGVVGPNGCGKSNIVDAIRWVMGEQSAKTLRGKQMEDIIFGGSETRKPLGMTEVSLFFSTADGRIPAKYLNFSEIQITRRLYRDGDSDYLLNGTPCRLLDITELFMDTGAGAKAYSIIEQGKIGMILSSKPEERRLIIEEAAGVTKFKARKQVAVKKIELTKQNLLRIADIIAEIRRQLNSLQRQAKKAEKFKEYREELREIELLFAVRGYQELLENRAHIAAELAQLRHRSTEAAHAAEQGVLELEERRIVLLEEEKRLGEVQEENLQLRGEISARENRLAFQRKEEVALRERLARFSQELAGLDGRAADAGEELRLLTEHTADLLASLAAEEVSLTGAERALAALQEEETLLVSGLDGRRRELFALGAEVSQLNNQHGAVSKRLGVLAELVARSRRESLFIQEQQQEAADRVVGQEESCRSLTSRKAALELDLAALRDHDAQLRTRLAAVEHRYQGERDRLTTTASRLHSLQELEAQFAGYGQGVRNLCLAEPFKGRLQGVVADIFEVAEEYELALEAALADCLQYVLCKGSADAREAIGFLRDSAGGRCSLVMPDVLSVPEIAPPAGGERLLDHVTVSERYTTLAGVLLGRTFIAETLDAALSLGRKSPQLIFVTRDGDMVTAGGIVHGGSAEVAQQGLIHKKRMIKELSAEVRTLEARVAELAAERERLGADVRVTEESLRTCRQELHQTEIELVNAEKDLLRVRDELQRLGERLSLKIFEDDQLQEERQTLEQDVVRFEQQRAHAEHKKALADQELTALQHALEDKQRQINGAREHVTSQKVALAALREKHESGTRTMTRIRNDMQDVHGRRSLLEAELGAGERELQRLCAAIAADAGALEEFLDKQCVVEESCAALRSRYETEAGSVRDRESQLRGVRDAAEKLSQAVGEQALQLSEIEMRLQNSEMLVAEKFRCALTDLLPVYGDRQYDEQEQRSRQAELVGLIDAIGEVNLTAIEEYRELDERFVFLSDQKADLEESLHGLQQAIQRINRTTRKRFLDTFILVNEKFQEIFPRLFCGGRAELRLTNEEDLLETGIDIVIQPPGKKLQNVMLLSGGEKALTAVALMFAIFLIKPAPFCLLDEVDAPLDDANIGRFNEMVREMSAISQFIIITHNKSTMTHADCLYGVTMEEPGVSRLVSVKLQ